MENPKNERMLKLPKLKQMESLCKCLLFVTLLGVVISLMIFTVQTAKEFSFSSEADQDDADEDPQQEQDDNNDNDKIAPPLKDTSSARGKARRKMLNGKAINSNDNINAVLERLMAEKAGKIGKIFSNGSSNNNSSAGGTDLNGHNWMVGIVGARNSGANRNHRAIPMQNSAADKAKRDAEKAKQEQALLVKSLKTVTEPLKCKKSRSLDKSPYLLKKYGSVEENWCEMTQSITSEWKDELLSKPNSTKVFNNGTTYVDYPSSADGIDWPYYKCPIQRKIRCNSNNNNAMRKKTKALVIYIVSSGGNAYQQHQESVNTDFFIKNGYITANTPTALFDSVDFVFAKVQLTGEKTESKFVDCGNLSSALGEEDGKHSNVKFMMIPKVSCDLAAHAVIMDKLGLFSIEKVHHDYGKNRCIRIGDTDYFRNLFEPPPDNVGRKRKIMCAHELKKSSFPDPVAEGEYSQVIMMNSGVRGPFFSSADDDESSSSSGDPKTTWVDYVSMAGRFRIPNPRSGFFNDNTPASESHDCPVHVSVSSSISYELGIHHQSYFLSMPQRLMDARISKLFANLLPSHVPGKKDKVNCIVKGEVGTGRAVLVNFAGNSSYGLPAAMYSLAKQYYVHDFENDNRQKGNFYWHPPMNPSYSWLSPCQSVFVKAGGEAFLNKRFPNEVVNAMDRLTRGAGMATNGDAGASKSWNAEKIRKMFSRLGCQWKF